MLLIDYTPPYIPHVTGLPNVMPGRWGARPLTAALTVLVLACVVSAPGAAPRSPEEWLRRAADLLARADTTAAIRVLEHSHLDDHTDARASVLLGTLYRKQGTIAGRLRSQRVLENARLRFPRDPDVCMELGRTYFAQRFFPASVACFERTLQLDPGRCGASYMIGLYHYRNWKRVNDFHDNLVRAKNWLRDAWTCDDRNADAALLYLYARYVLHDASVREADLFLSRFSDRPEFHLYRGVLAYDDERYENCARYFERGLDLLSSDDRAMYDNLASVLPITEFDRYLETSPERVRALRRGYWLTADPDPTSIVNERELEHVYRVFLADVLYSNDWTGQRGWDTDRGQAFIKFGRPMHIEYTLGENDRTGYEERWSYVLGGVFQEFFFVDEFLNGTPRIPYTADVLVHFMLHEPELSALLPRVAPVPGALDVVAFRDDDLHGSFYAAMRVNADTLAMNADPASTNRYVIRGAYFDQDWNRDGGVADTVWTSGLARRVTAGAHVLEFVRRVPVAFDDYHVAWSFEDEHVRARAIERADADLERFANNGLTLSDVLLFDGEPGPPAASAGSITDTIDRGNGCMRPRIAHGYGPSEPLRAYLEVYHLNVAGGASAYDVRYSIYPAVRVDSPVWVDWLRAAGRMLGLLDGAPVIAQSFVRQGTSHTERERITIDISALEAGDYELVVEVTDRNSGDRATTQASLTREATRVAGGNTR